MMRFIFLTITLLGSFIQSISQTLPSGIKMKDIPAGTFTMGNNNLTGSPDQKAAAPEHEVTLSAYTMSEAEITNSQYVEFLNAAFADGLIEIVTGTAGPDNGLQLIAGTSSSAYSGKVLYNLNGTRVMKDHDNAPPSDDDNEFTGVIEPENPLNTSYIGFNSSNNQFYIKNPHDVSDFHWYDMCDYYDYGSTKGTYETTLKNDFDDWSGAGNNYSDELEGWTESNPSAATKLPKQADVAEWPVTFVRWWGAWAFADYYDMNLPTEAQWERAAKAGQGFKYAVYDGSTISDANWNEAGGHPSKNHVRAAISGTANPYGLYNLAGNAWEWIRDNYVAPYSTAAVTDPIIEESGSTLRCWRGGSWNYHEATLQSDIRFSDQEDRGNDHFGFRIVGAATSTTGTTWDGSESTSWADADNWSDGKVPTSADDVTIPATTNAPTITGDAAVNDIDIAIGVIITVESGASLAIFGTATGDGKLTVKRKSTGNSGYSIIGSPVSGAVESDLNAQYLYEYAEPSGAFTAPVGMLRPGKGYFTGYDEASPQITLTGTPVTGTQTIQVTNVADGFNLVANPYAAAISTNAFLNNANNQSVLDGSVYFWDDGGSNVGSKRGGDYVTMNHLGATNTNNLSDGVDGNQGLSAAQSGYITSVQGFFVNAGSAANVEFTADMQVTTGNANADANHYRKNEASKQLIRLALIRGENYSEILIGMTDNATMERDYGLDALKLSADDALSFYSLIEGNKYAIQGVPPVSSEAIKVPLGFDAPEEGIYTFKVIETKNMDSGVLVNLLDAETGQTYNLNELSSFEFVSSASQNIDRFQLVLSPGSILQLADQAKNEIKVFGTASALSIQSANSRNQTVTIHELSGRKVFSEKVLFENQKTMINTSLAASKVYILTIGNNKIKFVLK